MPIQPRAAQEVRGWVEVLKEYAPGLKDLEGFSHIILLDHLHRAKRYMLTVTPFLDTQPRGLFATRAPKRLNPSGQDPIETEEWGIAPMRPVARSAGALVVGFWMFAGIASAINERGPWTRESFIMGALIAATVLGVLVAWRRERLGSALLIAVAVAHSTFAYIASGHNHLLAMLIIGEPILVVGLLFLSSACLDGKPKERSVEIRILLFDLRERANLLTGP